MLQDYAFLNFEKTTTHNLSNILIYCSPIIILRIYNLENTTANNYNRHLKYTYDVIPL